MESHLILIDSLRREVLRLQRHKLELTALEARELRSMLDDHAEMVYEALRTRPTVDAKYRELVRLCDSTRSYEIPPEYSGVLNTEERGSWSPTDTEIARVLVASTIADPTVGVFYADLVRRIGSITSTSRPHIYRSLKVILRVTPERGSLIDGIRLK